MSLYATIADIYQSISRTFCTSKLSCMTRTHETSQNAYHYEVLKSEALSQSMHRPRFDRLKEDPIIGMIDNNRLDSLQR